MIKDILFRLLERLFPPARMSDEELIAWGAAQEQVRLQYMKRVCEVHIHEPLQRVGRIGSGQYVCMVCCERNTRPLNRPFIDYVQERHTDKDAGPITQEHRAIHVTGKTAVVRKG